MPLVKARCIRFLTQLVLIACFGLTWSSPPFCVAQDTEKSLEDLQQQWQKLDNQLVAQEKELKSGEGDSLVLQKEYRDLVDQATKLIGQLKKTATAKLESEPNSPNAIRTLMGIMLNDAEQNRDAEVLALGDILIANGINPEYFRIASRSERLSIASREIFDELIIRQAETMQGDLPRVRLQTTQGDIVIELFENEAPNTVGNFISLVENGFYTDLLFHRVIEGFMAQGGGFKLEGDEEVGGKGPGYEIKCECETPDRRLHFANGLSMAHRGKDTGGSQFFITFERTSFLDGRHTCFGRVIDGQEVLEALTRTHISSPQGEQPIPGITKDKIKAAKVIRKRDHKYRPDKIGGNEEQTPDETKEKESYPELSAPDDAKDEAADSEKKKADTDAEKDGDVEVSSEEPGTKKTDSDGSEDSETTEPDTETDDDGSESGDDN